MINPAGASSFTQFAESLLVDFSSRDDVPLIKNENDWKQWGNLVSSLPSFANRGVPTTENFSNWKDWGIIVYDTMAR